MQTRRDQLHAYRFQNRRALAALVTGEPNVLEPPMRRLTVVTISGIMIAILIACGFALLGVFKPAAGDKWKDAGAIVVERETGARYVYLNGELDPVLNYTSAVLAVGTNQHPHVVLVNRSDIRNVKRGPTIGIDKVPDSLPSAASLVTSPWTVCSREQLTAQNQLVAEVSELAGSDAGARALPGNQAVVVQAAGGGQQYLLYNGQRLAIGGASINTSLGFENTPALPVGTAFLDGVPAGPDLAAPDVPGAGAAFSAPVNGSTVRVGQLLRTGDGREYLVLRDGIAQLTTVQTDILRTLRIPPAGKPLPEVATSDTSVLSLPQSRTDWQSVSSHFGGLPTAVPQVTAAAYQNGGVCAVYRGSSNQPAFALPHGTLPQFADRSSATQSETSKRGLADSVVVPPGRAALVQAGDGSATVFVVAEPGLRYPVTSNDVLAGLGYGSAKAVKLPAQLLTLIQTGPALNPTAARRPAS